MYNESKLSLLSSPSFYLKASLFFFHALANHSKLSNQIRTFVPFLHVTHPAYFYRARLITRPKASARRFNNIHFYSNYHFRTVLSRTTTINGQQNAVARTEFSLCINLEMIGSCAWYLSLAANHGNSRWLLNQRRFTLLNFLRA